MDALVKNTHRKFIARLCALGLIALTILPFTDPFKVVDLADLGAPLPVGTCTDLHVSQMSQAVQIGEAVVTERARHEREGSNQSILVDQSARALAALLPWPHAYSLSTTTPARPVRAIIRI
jgi:hypothetical protein